MATPREQLEKTKARALAQRQRYAAEKGRFIAAGVLVGVPVVNGYVRGRWPTIQTIPGTKIGSDTAVGGLFLGWGLFFARSPWPLLIGASLLGQGLGRRAQMKGMADAQD